MSTGPEDWLRDLAANLRTDPGLPPGVIVLKSGPESVARTASHPGGLVTGELREDLASFAESFPYFIRMDQRGEPIRCEICGTLVALTPESGTGLARWKPAVWEYETLRKHTLRRCEWKRANH